MTVSAELLGLAITVLLFIATAVGWGMKYATDQQALRSKNDMQDEQLKTLKEQQVADREHNMKQHEEFYENKNTTIELKNDMKHIMASLDDIKALLGERRSSKSG